MEGVVLVAAILPSLLTAVIYVAIAICILRIRLPLITAPPIHIVIPAVTGIRIAGTVGHAELLTYDARAEGYACLYTYS
jgi:hypothetical protein